MEMEQIYLDHAATTPVSKEVLETMNEVSLNTFGNPSSIHSFGRNARKALDDARALIAKSVGAKEKEIIFTSGGTESDNLALIGTALKNKERGNHIITTEAEHHAVLHAAEYLETKGFDVTYLPVSEQGTVSPDDLKSALREDTILVSIMFVNNETGVIQPIEEIGSILKDHSAYFHVDAVQAFGTIEIDVKKLNVDLMSVSGHKISGPKGIGFLYASTDAAFAPLSYGGEQERKRRAGTENTSGIAGLAKAVEMIVANREENAKKYTACKDAFLSVLKSEQVDFFVNGQQDLLIPGTVNISFPGTDVEQLLVNFDLSSIAAASGSACTAGSHEPSHVLVSMFGEKDARTRNSVRFSFGSLNTEEQSKEAAKRVAKIVNRLAKRR